MAMIKLLIFVVGFLLLGLVLKLVKGLLKIILVLILIMFIAGGVIVTKDDVVAPPESTSL